MTSQVASRRRSTLKVACSALLLLLLLRLLLCAVSLLRLVRAVELCCIYICSYFAEEISSILALILVCIIRTFCSMMYDKQTNDNRFSGSQKSTYSTWYWIFYMPVRLQYVAVRRQCGTILQLEQNTAATQHTAAAAAAEVRCMPS